MSHQHLFPEALAVTRGNHLRRHAGQVGVAAAILRAEQQRHQPRPSFTDRQPELSRQVISESGGAHLRNRQAAGGHDQRRSAKFVFPCPHHELVGPRHLLDCSLREQLNSRLAALLFQHVQNVLRGAIAKKLAQSLLVIRDAVFLDQGDEIGRGVAGQRRFGEVRIGRDEVFRRAVDVGEIAAAAAGDKNFLPQPLGAFEDGHPPPPLARFDGAHQSGSAAAENQSVIFMDQEKEAHARCSRTAP